FRSSSVRFYHISQGLAADASKDQSGKKIIRVTHWQLEPGYRQGLQWAIDEYNKLPHVKAAKVEVVQAPIPQRIYNQFMNVHLISGTAPDISAKGFTRLIQGNALARFYAPLGDYVEEPNPYNTQEYQIPGLPDELSNYLKNARWMDTFFDGMQGGYDNGLNDYYAISVSTTGGVRLFYNMDILASV